MNKKILFGMFAAAVMLFATSCQKEDLTLGEETVVSFTLEQTGIGTRAYSEGTNATTLTYAVYETGSKTPRIIQNDMEFDVNVSTSVKLNLLTGKSYDIIFWADAENAPYTFDEAAQTITVDYTGATSQDDNRDAFFAAVKGLEVKGASSQRVKLTRPFAQLNIGTTDAEEAIKAGFDFDISQSSVTVSNVYNTLDLLNGNVFNSGSGSNAVNFGFANIPGDGETFPGADAKYLSMNYLLVSSDQELVDIDFTVKSGSYKISRKYNNVPVQRNYRTNISGTILTNSVDVTIETVLDYDGNLTPPGVDMGNGVLWASTVYGATEDNPYGTYMTVAEVADVEGYRLPTEAEAKYLIDKCTWEKTTVDGVACYNVTGNGNTIFMPAVHGISGLEGMLYIAIGVGDSNNILAFTDLDGYVEIAGHWIGTNTKFPVYLVVE